MKLNLSYYRGIDLYSEGKIESELLRIVNSRRNLEEIVRKDHRWPILYHFSKLRENLLNWYPFNKDRDLVLEIGSGCGALTPFLCSKTAYVTAVELSKKRSEIISARLSEAQNLELVVGNVHEIKFNNKYDYVILIGVLEYASKFINSLTAHLDLLQLIKSLLNNSGKLLLAIENKFGMKYFAGAREDHTGRLFDSIEGYPKNKSVSTFGKFELESLLTNSGFTKLKFYYPYPDYKFPDIIFSDDKLPSEEDIFRNSPSFNGKRLQLFNENLALKGVIRNKMFTFFSNSFLVEATF